MADSPTQEKVREAVAHATFALEYAEKLHEAGVGGGTVALEPAMVRTLLAAITTAEADLAEARKLMKPFAKFVARVSDDWSDDTICTTGYSARVYRALAAFHNKGEE
jgi:aspartate/methionine/tyrosine aminotransferase